MIQNKDNRGFAAANNQAFQRCTGRYILLLNSDTIIIGDALAISVQFLEEEVGVGALGCRVLNSDKSLQRTCSGFPTLWGLFFMTLGLDKLKLLAPYDTYLYRFWDRKDLRDIEVITGCYLMIRRSVFNDIGGLDEQFFFFGEETDWCRRIKDAGWRLVFLPNAEIIHHGGGSVKKLKYKRDVMLTAATVRLHHKYGGLYGAVFAYTILMIFNISRALIWGGVSLLKKSIRAKAIHFFQVSKSWRECWPQIEK